jgi:hypothetical protein
VPSTAGHRLPGTPADAALTEALVQHYPAYGMHTAAQIGAQVTKGPPAPRLGHRRCGPAPVVP